MTKLTIIRRKLVDAEWEEEFVSLYGAHCVFLYLEQALLKFR